MKKRIHSMTLRLSPEIAEAVENRAFERGISQADWIRLAIRRSLIEAHEDESQVRRKRATGGNITG
jgi:predicted DNA binding CopG/RHH family protein